MARLPLNTLQGFAAAARSGNLTRAAASMHLTVSALSHQIRALEEHLGRRLFDRGTRERAWLLYAWCRHRISHLKDVRTLGARLFPDHFFDAVNHRRS